MQQDYLNTHEKHKLSGVSNLLVSLGYTGRRVVWGYILNPQTLMKTDEKKKMVLSKFTILCWATFIAFLATCGPWAAGWTPLEALGLVLIFAYLRLSAVSGT